MVFADAHVITTDPPANAINIAADISVSAVFDSAMNAASFSDTTFYCRGDRTGLHPGTITYTPATRTAVLDPVQNFLPGEVVTVVLGRGLTDSLGTAFPGYAWQFTIACREGSALLLGPIYLDTDLRPFGIFAADFDADTILDLAVTNQTSNTLLLFFGIGDGTFGSPVRYSTGLDPRAVAGADLDRDGDLDCIVTNATDNTMWVYLNDGSGGLTFDSSYATGTNPTGLVLVELNRDGRLDAVTVNRSANNISVFLGNGDGTFLAPAAYLVGNGPTTVTAGDVDHDADLDIVVNLRNTNKVKVMFNAGDGTFIAGNQYTTASRPNAMILGCLNAADRFLDAATANEIGRSVSVLPGNGDGSFGLNANYPAPAIPVCLTAADLDADADLDLVVSSSNRDSLTVFLNDGSAVFTRFNSYAAGDSQTVLDNGDFNRDGSMDIAVVSNTTNRVAVFLNSTDSLAPGPPQNLLANGANPSPWTRDSIFVLAWLNPSDPSGIRRALFKLGSPPAADYDTTGSLRAIAPDTVVDLVQAGDPLYLWLQDNAGNADYLNQAVVLLRRDQIPPSASVASSPAYSRTPDFTVSWTVGVDSGGSGLTYRYDVMVRDGTGPWGNWLTDYSGLSAVYSGADDHRYYFEAASRDSAGNIGTLTGIPECSTLVDTMRPQVLATLPALGDTGIVPNTMITAYFSELMDSLSMVPANFSITGDSSGSHGFTVAYQSTDSQVTLDPTINFRPHETVTATVRLLVTDRAGNQMASDKVWTFRIGTSTDTQGPVTSSGNALPNPCEPIANVIMSAYLSDAGHGDNIVNAAEFFVDAAGGNGTGYPMAPVDSQWNEISEDIVGTLDNDLLGWAVNDTHDILIHGRDVAGNWGAYDTVAVVVTADDDTAGPVFDNFNPVQWPDTAGFNLSAQISDPSGVYDDTTGSVGQGVYLRWDNDGELIIDAFELTMYLLSGSYYKTDSVIPQQAAGAAFVYEIYAWDNDFDTQHPGDRKQSTSGLQSVAIQDVRGPAASNVAASPNPTHGALLLAVQGTFSDSLLGNSGLAAAECFVDAPGIDSTGFMMSPLDSAWGEVTESAADTLDISSWPYGTYRWLFVHGLDLAGNWGKFDSVRVTVTPPEDTIPPFVLATSPDSAETGVARNRNIYITFSEPMDEVSLDTSKFHVRGSIHPAFSYALTYDSLSATVVLDPDSLFAALESVSVDVSNTVIDTAGNGMLDPYFFWFRAGAQSDTIGPGVANPDVYPDTTMGARYGRVTALISDSATGGSAVLAAEIFIDTIRASGTGYPCSPQDSVWDEVSEPVYRQHSLAGLALGPHRIYVHGRDAADNWGRFDSLPLMVTPDDDTIGPVFSLFRPDSVPDTSGFYIYCVITDPSDVYDDSTGSNGQGVYVVWNVTGVRLAEDAELLMSRVSADTFRTDFKIPVQVTNAVVSYEIFAYDNDFDFGEIQDRKQGRSGLRNVLVYDARGPSASYIQVSPPNPPAGISRVVVYAAISDSTAGQTHIDAAEVFLDSTGLPWTGDTMSAADGAFDEVYEPVLDTFQVSGWLAGQTHKFYVRGRDGHGNWSKFDSITIYVSPYIDTIPPGIAFTVPARGDTGVALNSWVFATFNERVDPTTVTSDKILVEGDLGGVYTFWMSYNTLDSTLSINPYNNFQLQESVTVWISSGIKDLVGNVMPTGYSWWFRCGDTTVVEDTIPPILELTVDPNPAHIGDSVLITVISNEPLRTDSAVICTVWTVDSVPHRLVLDSTLSGYTGYVSTIGFARGDCQVVVYGFDRAPFPNVGTAQVALHVGPEGEFLPPDMVYAWPSPARSAEVNFHFYINANARVTVDVYNLEGRRIERLEGQFPGGNPPHLPTSNALTWDIRSIASDIYIFRITAVSDATGERASVMKKFSIVK